MAARSALRSLLVGDPRLVELGFVEVYGQNAVDTPAEQRFIVIRWEQPEDVAYGSRAAERPTVWFHDRDRDYSQIQLGIERLKQLVNEAAHVSVGDGWVLTQARYISQGPDLADDGFGTVVRYANISVNSRYDGPV